MVSGGNEREPMTRSSWCYWCGVILYITVWRV